VYLAATGIEGAMPGGVLKVVHTPEEAAQVRSDLARVSHPVAEIADSGVAVFADTLGGLEALAFECREAKIPIHEAAVGPVGRPSVIRIATVKDPSHRAVLAFNVPILPDAQPEGDVGPVRIFRNEVMYRVIEEYQKWHEERLRALQVQRRLALVHPAKIQILPGNVFRASKPAIVGVKVLGGTLRSGVRLMRPDGTEIGMLRSLQRDGTSVAQAEEGSELAAAIEGAVVGRNVEEGGILLVAVPESAARILRRQPLTPSEMAILEEVIRIHRPDSPFWGQ